VADITVVKLLIHLYRCYIYAGVQMCLAESSAVADGFSSARRKQGVLLWPGLRRQISAAPAGQAPPAAQIRLARCYVTCYFVVTMLLTYVTKI
jgi:hypothetical protein